jgi:hypothetical protein
MGRIAVVRRVGSRDVMNRRACYAYDWTESLAHVTVAAVANALISGLAVPAHAPLKRGQAAVLVVAILGCPVHVE